MFQIVTAGWLQEEIAFLACVKNMHFSSRTFELCHNICPIHWRASCTQMERNVCVLSTSCRAEYLFPLLRLYYSDSFCFSDCFWNMSLACWAHTLYYQTLCGTDNHNWFFIIYNVYIQGFHRIIGWLGLEGTSRTIKFQPTCPRQGS